MGDGDGGRAHLGHDFADQVVDDAGHDRIEAGGGFVEEDDFRLGGDGAGEADALLHAARQLGRQAVGHFGTQPHAAELFEGDGAGLFLGLFQRAAQQTEGDVLPDGEGVEEGGPLEQHAEAGKKGVALAPALLGVGHVKPVDGDRALIGRHEAEDRLDEDGFPGAGAADDHHAGALGHMQVHPAQDVVGAEGFVNVGERDHAEKNASVRMKLAARISTAAATTEDFVARPTPMAPRPEFMP